MSMLLYVAALLRSRRVRFSKKTMQETKSEAEKNLKTENLSNTIT